MQGIAKIRKELCILLRVFFHTPRLCGGVVLEMIGVAAALIHLWMGMQDDVLLLLQNAQLICIWMFLFNLYLAYEFVFTLRKSGVEETIAAYKNGKIGLYGLSFLLLTILVVLQFIVMVLPPMIAAHQNQMPYEVYFHIFLITFLDTFLAGCLALLFGFCCGLRMERIKAYSLMAIFIFFMLPASNLIPGIMNDVYHVNIWPVKALFNNILLPGQFWTIDYQYGLSMEPIRWNAVLFWAGLFLAGIVLYVLSAKQKQRLVCATLCGAIVVLNLCGFIRGGSKIDLTEAPDSVFRTDQVYYRHHEPKEEQADFQISSYSMELDIGRELNASVKMELSNPNHVKDYKFTLYHLFRVSSIVDDAGQEMAFDQDGDYITVHPEEELNSLTMEYSGYSPMFYSNKQGVCLPGCFPYYPWAGFRQIYYATPDPQEGYVNFIARTDLPEAEYTVKLTGMKNLQTNLDHRDEYLWGKTNALSIMGSFLANWTYDVYPTVIACTAQSQEDQLDAGYLTDLQKEISKLESELGYSNPIDLRDYKIFQNNETMLNRCGYGLAVPLGNHIFITPYPDIHSVAYAITYLVHEGPALTVEEKMKSEGMSE